MTTGRHFESENFCQTIFSRVSSAFQPLADLPPVSTRSDVGQLGPTASCTDASLLGVLGVTKAGITEWHMLQG